MDYPPFTPLFLFTTEGVEAKGAGVPFFCSNFFFLAFLHLTDSCTSVWIDRWKMDSGGNTARCQEFVGGKFILCYILVYGFIFRIILLGEGYELRGILLLECPRGFYAYINVGKHKPHSILLLIIISRIFPVHNPAHIRTNVY